MCKNTRGSYRCLCRSGFVMGEDGYTCEGTNYYYYLQKNIIFGKQMIDINSFPEINYNNALPCLKTFEFHKY